MEKFIELLMTISFLSCLTSCLVKQEPKATHSELLVSRGDIVAASFTSDSLVAFNPNGTLKKVLYQLPNTVGDAIAGLAWLPETNEILLSIDGTPDRIDAFSVVTGNVRTFYNNTTYLTGTPLGIAQLKNSADVIISEGATIERFSANGFRETWTTIWPSNVHANAQQIVGLSTGNWLSCSSTVTPAIKISPDSTTNLTAVYTVASGIAGTTASYGCGELSNGSIVIGFNGTTDTLRIYDSTLATNTLLISNAAVFGDPRGIAIGENDEIYVADATRNMIVELDTSGNVIREFGNSYLQSPRSLIVIPDIN